MEKNHNLYPVYCLLLVFGTTYILNHEFNSGSKHLKSLPSWERTSLDHSFWLSINEYAEDILSKSKYQEQQTTSNITYTFFRASLCCTKRVEFFFVRKTEDQVSQPFHSVDLVVVFKISESQSEHTLLFQVGLVDTCKWSDDVVSMRYPDSRAACLTRHFHRSCGYNDHHYLIPWSL